MPIVTVGFSEMLEDGVKELTTKMAWMANHTMKLCASLDELRTFVDQAIESGRCAVDTETTSLNTRMKSVRDTLAPNGIRQESCAKMVAFCLAFESTLGLYVPVGHQEDEELNLPLDAVLEQINRLCKNCITIYHNAKYDLAVLKNYGIVINRYEHMEDTEILSRIYDAGVKFVGLKPTAEKILGRKMLEIGDISPGSKRLDLVSPRLAATYGASDAICTLDLFLYFISQQIVKDQMPIYNLEKRTLFVVLNMESNYVKIDVDYLTKAREVAYKKLNDVRTTVHQLAGREFNLGSSQQLGKLLFDDLGYTYPDKRKTATGQYKTDTSTLEKIAKQYPIVESVIEYRGLEKCVGTYVEKLIANHDEDGCVKLGFKQTGTDTGRFSSPGGMGIDIDGYCGINVQSLPGAKKGLPVYMPNIRRSLVARPGYTIVAMDYAGEELRVATNLSREPKWMEEFLHGDADIHSATARAIFQKNEITEAERGIGKTVNFLVLYGGGSRGLAEQAHISEREAKRLLDAFFKGLPILKKWIDREILKARKLKYSKTAFGRIRPLHMFYDSGDRGSEAHADRCAVNHLVQGSSADIIKTAMVRVFNYIQVHNLQDDIKILITMHDELVYEIKTEKLHEYIPILDNIMRLEDILQGILKWPVPLALDSEYGGTWHVTNNFFKENPDAHLKVPILFQKSEGAVSSEGTKDIESATEKLTEEKIPPLGREQDPNSEMSDVKQEPKLADFPIENTKSKEISEGDLPQNLIPQELGESPGAPPEENKDLLKNDLTSPETVIYTIKDRRTSTLRKLNDVLLFLAEEGRKEVGYQSPKRIVVIRDVEGNLLSEIRVQSDAFLALSRYYGL